MWVEKIDFFFKTAEKKKIFKLKEYKKMVPRARRGLGRTLKQY